MSISLLLTVAVGCGHTHDYSELKSDGTNHWYECSCGEKDGEEAHKGGTATCVAQAICEVCDAAYGDLATEHAYGAWTSNGNNTHTRVCANDSTHTESADCTGGTATCVAKAVCEACNTEYGEIDATAHSFTNYNYNDDASFGKNGTETATCDNGCGATDTRESVGTAIMEMVLDDIDYAKNRAEALVIDLTDYNVESLVAVSVNGEEVEYSFENGKISISNDKLSNGVVIAGSKSAISEASVLDSSIVATTSNNCTISIAVNVADYAIGTEEEFVAWVTDVKTNCGVNGTLEDGFDTSTRRAAKNYDVYFTDHVTLTNVITNTDKGFIEGYIDGRGYSLSNLRGEDGGYSALFRGIGAVTFENLAILNATQPSEGNPYGYLIGQFSYCHGIMNNCYVEFNSEANSGQSGLTNLGSQWVIKNSILKLDYASTTTAAYRTDAPLFTNVFTISSEKRYLAINQEHNANSTNHAMFATIDALYEALNAEEATVTVDGFANNAYWTITEEEGKITSIAWKNLPAQAE